MDWAFMIYTGVTFGTGMLWGAIFSRVIIKGKVRKKELPQWIKKLGLELKSGGD